MNYQKPPVWMHLGATGPSRCTVHKMPDMLKSAKEVVPITIKTVSTAVGAVEKPKKEVLFAKGAEEVDACRNCYSTSNNRSCPQCYTQILWQVVQKAQHKSC